MSRHPAVGGSHLRSDGRAKARGEAVYSIDHREPGMLHGVVVRSPVAHARIEAVDTTAAERCPGVRAVLTGADTPWRGGWWVTDQTALARERVRYQGDPVVAIAADTLAQARAAAEAVVVRYAELPVVADVDEALAPGAPLLHEDWASHTVKLPVQAHREGNLAWEATFTHGDVDGLFAAADVIVEQTYEVQRQHQLYLEPRAAVATWRAGRVTVHTSSQYPFNARERVAELNGLPIAAVRIVGTTIGGGFGGKLDAAVEPIAALLARATGRPVRMVNTLEEDLTTAPVREGARVRIRTAASRSGELLAHDALFLMDSGAHCGETPALASVPGVQLCASYRVAAARIVTRLVYTNTAPTGAFRGTSGPYLQFVVERQLDHVAERLGMDRRELRLRNAWRSGDVMPNGQQLRGVAFAEAYERVEERRPWRGGGQRRTDGLLHGVGIGALTWVTSPMPGSATVAVNEDGSVTVSTAAAEVGSGAVAQGVRQVVAHELGVDPDVVHVTLPDTDHDGFDASAQGSRTTYSTGGAARNAAIVIRDEAREVAAEMLEAAVEDIELADGHVGVKGSPSSAVPLATVARVAMLTRGGLRADQHNAAPPIPHARERFVGAAATAINGTTFHVHLAEVTVDPQTGEVRVTRYVVAQDVGRIINPMSIRGQVQGGVAQGIGYALFEQLRHDEGIVVDRSLESYRIPTALDVPNVEMILLEYPDPTGPLGAKGAAEPPIVPVAGIVASAVSDAIGRQVTRLPITPADVLDLLNEKERA